MEPILVHAQGLVYLLLDLMPTHYQHDSLETLLGLFLDASGKPLPHYSKLKSESALSRFLNQYAWPTRKVIRMVRGKIVERLLKYAPRGRRPQLQLIVDLTSLEKVGKFKKFANLIHVLHGKRGMHVVLSTRPLKGSTISWWGKRRWSIEGFFKTSKHRFGLDRFGQKSLKGVYRWFVLCLISFVLAHWAYLSTGSSELPDWKVAATLALGLFLADVVVCNLLADLERTRPLLHSMGIDLQLIQLEI